jgi:ketosteroid isomerase-like protein
VPMTAPTTTSPFDAAAMRRAFDARDAGALLALYADDAAIELVDQQNPPSRPRRIQGKEALRAHLEDVFSRDMTHELDLVAVSPESVGYSLRCRYADGTRVTCAATGALRDGRIVREVGVQAWDS